jgi:hypothetical protein
MKFATLKELINYIPNCIICGKDMEIYFGGYNNNLSFLTKLTIDGDLIRPADNLIPLDRPRYRAPKYVFAININNNEIVDGEDLLNKASTYNGRIDKKCKTCIMAIHTSFTGPGIKRMKIIPEISGSLEIEYTMSNTKKIRIRDHWNIPGCIDITIGYKDLITKLPIDFSKIKTLKQLNKKISTIITFQ